jgi:hypothetical protein
LSTPALPPVKQAVHQKGDEMNTNRKTATMVGILYIIGTVVGILSVVITGPILGNSDYLVRVAANPNKILIGALFMLIMGLVLAFVPLLMFPILKKYDESLALGYVVFRGALETISYIASIITWLFLIALSRQYVETGAPNASYFQTLGAIVLRENDSITALTEIIFPIGAMIFYYLLYQTRLIPRWLSGWGIISLPLYLGAGLYHLFSSELSLLLMPMALQEMVMAVWMIVKGFQPSAVASSGIVPAASTAGTD